MTAVRRYRVRPSTDPHARERPTTVVVAEDGSATAVFEARSPVHHQSLLALLAEYGLRSMDLESTR
jgi:hypothetical protein